MLKDREEQVDEAIAALEAAEEGYESVLVAEAGYEALYKEAFADAFEKADAKNADMSKQLATKATAEQLKQWNNLKALVKAQSSRIDNARAILSARQTLASASAKRNV